MADPRLILSPDGSRLQFINGQVLIDDGLENQALISLFTGRGWCGNKFLPVKIGSDFEDECNKPITRQQINRIRIAAERALACQAFGRVTVTVTNPVGHRVNVTALVEQTGQRLTLTRIGQSWQFQAESPAYVNADKPSINNAITFNGSETTFGGGTVLW